MITKYSSIQGMSAQAFREKYLTEQPSSSEFSGVMVAPPSTLYFSGDTEQKFFGVLAERDPAIYESFVRSSRADDTFEYGGGHAAFMFNKCGLDFTHTKSIPKNIERICRDPESIIIDPFAKELYAVISNSASGESHPLLWISLCCGMPNYCSVTRAAAQALGASGFIGVDSRDVIDHERVNEFGVGEFTSIYLGMDMVDFLDQLSYDGPLLFEISGLAFVPPDLAEHCVDKMQGHCKKGDGILVGYSAEQFVLEQYNIDGFSGVALVQEVISWSPLIVNQARLYVKN